MKHLRLLPLFFLSAVLTAILAPVVNLIALALLFFFTASIVVLLVCLPWMKPKPAFRFPEDLIELLGIFVPFIALTAVLRALTVGVYRHYPQVLEWFDRLFRPLAERFGNEAIARMDFYWAIVGIIGILVFSVLDGIWRLLTLRQIQNLPTAKVRSVAMGLAELSGRARPMESGSTSRPLLRYAFVKRGDRIEREEHKKAFYLEDETGRILVDPSGAEFVASEVPVVLQGGRLPQRLFGARICEILLTKRQRLNEFSLPDFELHEGDPVYVIGHVEKLNATGPELVIRRRTGALKGHQFYNVFFLADSPEMETRRYFWKGLFYAYGYSLVALCLCVYLLMHARAGRADFGATYGYSLEKPAVAVVPEIPIAARSAEIRGLGTLTVPQMLAIVREGPPGNALTVLPLLDALGARESARRELQGVLRESNNPHLVQIARGWLLSWGDSILFDRKRQDDQSGKPPAAHEHSIVDIFGEIRNQRLLMTCTIQASARLFETSPPPRLWLRLFHERKLVHEQHLPLQPGMNKVLDKPLWAIKGTGTYGVQVLLLPQHTTPAAATSAYLNFEIRR